jgi:flagellar capping protein FliD
MQAERAKWTDERIDELGDQIRAMDKKLDDRFDRIDARFDKVDARFEALEVRFERRFDTLIFTLIVVLGGVVATLGGALVVQSG